MGVSSDNVDDRGYGGASSGSHEFGQGLEDDSHISSTCDDDDSVTITYDEWYVCSGGKVICVKEDYERAVSDAKHFLKQNPLNTVNICKFQEAYRTNINIEKID